MSFADEDELDAFIGRDTWLPHVNAENVERKLDGFALPLLPHVTFVGLARSVRRGLAITMRDVDDGPHRKSNADTRMELGDLATRAEATWRAIFERSPSADGRLWRYAYQVWDGVGGQEVQPGWIPGEPADYKRFHTALAELDWLRGFVSRAGKATESQRGPWRESEKKRIRIERGQVLAVIFESYFGAKITVNNWGNGDERHTSKTPFMDFYSRMVTLAFDAHETTNLSQVLKVARRHHLTQPAEVGKLVLPRLAGA